MNQIGHCYGKACSGVSQSNRGPTKKISGDAKTNEIHTKIERDWGVAGCYITHMAILDLIPKQSRPFWNSVNNSRPGNKGDLGVCALGSIVTAADAITNH